jgi:diaminohydroxyphosphoribosylaminopyrimidine deaminase/5-amino-6-(5-phosphoribosylamino)uracil reductase
MINNSLNNTELNNLYISRCLQLAHYGAGYVAPNPMVGCVIVCDGKVIGEGYHHRYGEAHAEPNAINSVKDKSLLSKSTLYVSLEPCSHFGKTPPCANLIIESQIPRVVIGTLDPNPKVAGRGVKLLQDAGIEVEVGFLTEACRELNKRFFIYQEQKRCYVLLKWAQTKDGFMDRIRTNINQAPLQISNSFTRQLTHKMRSENQAIMVSTNTVILDNPSLTVRNWTGKSPIRIAIDRQGRIPKNYTLFNQKLPTIIFTEKEEQNSHNLEFIRINFDDNCLTTILEKLYEKNIHSVMVEGGAKLLNSMIEANLWDEANIEISNECIGDGVKAPNLPALPSASKLFEGHQWLSFKNNNK